MNVRIEEQNLRFKISEEELAMLLGGHPVHTKVALLEKTLVATINPKGAGKSMVPKLVLDDTDVYLNLLVPPLSVQELSEMGRSRVGLQQDIDGMFVSLQVDLREDSRKVAKR